MQINSELLKQLGTAGIYIMAGVLIWLLSKIGNLNLSLGDIAVLIVILSGGAYVGYALIKFFTGASISDLAAVKDLLSKLMDIIEGNKESNSAGESDTVSDPES